MGEVGEDLHWNQPENSKEGLRCQLQRELEIYDAGKETDKYVIMERPTKAKISQM